MNIVISGMSCSGKSTLGDKIDGSLHFEEDWYFKDKKDIPCVRSGYLFDSINAFNINEFKKDVDKLLKDGYVYVPSYDVVNNRRVSKNRIIYRKDNNVFEGLHVINILKDLRDSLKIFMDIPFDICLMRRIQRDKGFGISEEEVIRYFNEVMIPMYRCYIEPQKEYADLIIKGDDDIKCLLKKFQNY